MTRRQLWMVLSFCGSTDASSWTWALPVFAFNGRGFDTKVSPSLLIVLTCIWWDLA